MLDRDGLGITQGKAFELPPPCSGDGQVMIASRPPLRHPRGNADPLPCAFSASFGAGLATRGLACTTVGTIRQVMLSKGPSPRIACRRPVPSPGLVPRTTVRWDADDLDGCYTAHLSSLPTLVDTPGGGP
jgi:hypothetical protein